MRFAIVAMMVGSVALAAPAEAKTLPWGAEAGANKDGSIPAWTGPKGAVTLKNKSFSDPFASDKPLFTITGANYQKYKANLSEGQIAMLKRYANYKIPVYKTRRIFDLPAWAKTAIGKEQGRVSLLKDQGLKGLDLSPVPFPKPKNGLEAIWNHIVRFRGETVKRASFTAAVQQNGATTPALTEERIAFRRGIKKSKANANILVKYLNVGKSPARLQGRAVLVHEYIDQITNPRDAWLYNNGTRRVRRLPNLAYDAPLEFSGATATTDDFDMFNGAPNKYSWKLLGKREMYVPANAYRMNKKVPLKSIVMKGHLNPQYTRYEKRRVWVVEANLKKKHRHVYHKRVFYLDEDGWSIVLSDQWDGRGGLWKVKEAHPVYISTNKATFTAAQTVYDLKTGLYLALGLLADSKSYVTFDEKIPDRDFTTGALRRKGR